MLDPTTYKLFLTISTSSILLPITGGLIAYKKLNRIDTKLLCYFILFAFVEFTMAWTSRHNINNMPILHIFSMFEYLFLTYLFYSSINDEQYRKMIVITIVLFIGFAIFALFYFSGIFEFNTETVTFESLLLVLYSLCYFNYLSKQIIKEQLNVFKIPMFWLSIGVLFYFTGNFFLFLFQKQIAEINPQLWSLHSILNIMSNSLFMVSFLCKLK